MKINQRGAVDMILMVMLVVVLIAGGFVLLRSSNSAKSSYTAETGKSRSTTMLNDINTELDRIVAGLDATLVTSSTDQICETGGRNDFKNKFAVDFHCRTKAGRVYSTQESPQAWITILEDMPIYEMYPTFPGWPSLSDEFNTEFFASDGGTVPESHNEWLGQMDIPSLRITMCTFDEASDNEIVDDSSSSLLERCSREIKENPTPTREVLYTNKVPYDQAKLLELSENESNRFFLINITLNSSYLE